MKIYLKYFVLHAKESYSIFTNRINLIF